MYFFNKLKQDISKAVTEINGLELDGSNFTTPPNPSLGDLSLNIAFQLAEKNKSNPKQEAENLAEKISKIEGVKEIKTAGPYINFFFDYSLFSEKVLKEAVSENYGSSKKGQGKTIFIDYSSVNIAKPMHVGHLRSTIIGDSLYKLLEYLGFNCFGENYLGDWGLQLGSFFTLTSNGGMRKN